MPAFTLLGKEGSDLLDSALALPKQSAFGKDAYPTVCDKAAVLFRSLVRNHCLVDGNKRLATAAALVFLIVNGQLLFAEPEELIEQALRMASPQGLSWKTMSRWLKRRSYDMMDPVFLSHLEGQFRQARVEGTLPDADLRQTIEFFSILPNNPAGGDVLRSLLVLWKGVLGGKLPDTVLSVFRRSFEAAVQELRSK